MAQLSNQERNALRKVVRLLDLRENRGQASYDQTCEAVAAQVREMILPTDRFVVHVPEEYAFKAKVAWYETDANGVKHLFLHIEEPPEEPGEGGEPPPAQEAAS